jgi:hypothetical protein
MPRWEGGLIGGRLTWLHATSEDFPYLHALDCWLGYLADQQVSTVILEKDSDGNLRWHVSVAVAGGSEPQNGPGFHMFYERPKSALGLFELVDLGVL